MYMNASSSHPSQKDNLVYIECIYVPMYVSVVLIEHAMYYHSQVNFDTLTTSMISFGALSRLPFGDNSFGICSMVMPVIDTASLSCSEHTILRHVSHTLYSVTDLNGGIPRSAFKCPTITRIHLWLS